MKRRLLLCAAAAAFCFCGAAVADEEWEKVKDYDIKGKLTKGEKDVKYDDKTYRFRKESTSVLRDNQALTFTVTSTDYQPIMWVQNEAGTILKRAEIQPPVKVGDKKQYSCRLEFLAPERGRYTVVHSTATINQGAYQIVGALWTVPETTDAGAGSLPSTISGLKTRDGKDVAPRPKPTHHMYTSAWYYDDYEGDLKDKGRPPPASDADVQLVWVTPELASTPEYQSSPGLGKAYTPENVARQTGNVYYIARKSDKHRQTVLVLSEDHMAAARISVAAGYTGKLDSIVKAARKALEKVEESAIQR